MTHRSLHRIVKDVTGQDVFKCQGCFDCELPPGVDVDIPLGSMIQMIIYDDREVLSSRTLWSNEVMESSRHVCQRGLNIQVIMRALREESDRNP